MNVKNLEVGKTYKNYKELCEVLEIKPKGGKSKAYQLLDFKRYFTYDKEPNKYSYIILSIKDTPDIKINKNHVAYKQFSVEENSKYSKGVYKIQLDNKVYIGCTNCNFRKRFLQHIGGHNNTGLDIILKDGGTFEIIEEMNDSTKEEILDMEFYYTQKYRINKNIVLLNKRVKGLNKKEKMYNKKIKVKNIKVLATEYGKAKEALRNNNIKTL